MTNERLLTSRRCCRSAPQPQQQWDPGHAETALAVLDVNRRCAVAVVVGTATSPSVQSHVVSRRPDPQLAVPHWTPSWSYAHPDPQPVVTLPDPQLCFAQVDPLSDMTHTGPPVSRRRSSAIFGSVSRHLTSPAGCHRSRTFTISLSHHTPYTSGSSQHSSHPLTCWSLTGYPGLAQSVPHRHSAGHGYGVFASTATAAAPAHSDPQSAILSNRGRGSPHAGVSALRIRVLSKSNRRSHRKQ